MSEFARAVGTVLRNVVDLNAAPSSSNQGDWTWPPYAPVESAEAPLFGMDEWAPASSVRHPWVRIGRWTLLYRRAD